MQLRQVQAHEAPRDRLREVRRRGHPVQGAPRAPRAHQPGDPGRAHLVPEVAAVAHRQPARHHAQGPREDPLLRVVRRRRPEGDGSAARGAPHRGALHEGDRGVRRGGLRRRHGRRGDPRPAQVHRRPHALRAAARRDEGSDQRGQAQEAVQAPQGRRRLPRVRQQAGVDDAGRDPGDPAGSAPARPPRRRPLRDLRSQRPLPARHQPEQPPQAAPGAERPRDHHPQREADAAGGGRRPVRQRAPRQDHHRPQQAAAQVAVRHAQGQAGAVPPEPARQARRLLGPFASSSSAPSSSCTSAACPRRWRSSCSSRSSTTSSKSAASSPPSRARRSWWRRSVPRCGTSSKRSSRSTRSSSTAPRRCTAWASRPSSRC